VLCGLGAAQSDWGLGVRIVPHSARSAIAHRALGAPLPRPAPARLALGDAPDIPRKTWSGPVLPPPKFPGVAMGSCSELRERMSNVGIIAEPSWHSHALTRTTCPYKPKRRPRWSTMDLCVAQTDSFAALFRVVFVGLCLPNLPATEHGAAHADAYLPNRQRNHASAPK
jgi:hypothetical protein